MAVTFKSAHASTLPIYKSFMMAITSWPKWNLGVLVSQDLKPTAHIKQMVASAHRRANAILRSFFCREILTRLYEHLMCMFYRYLSIIL